MSSSITVYAQLIGGSRLPFEVPQSKCSVGALIEDVSHTVGRPPGSFKLVLKGKPVPTTESSVLALSEGDVFVVVPVRKAPPKSLISAALNAQIGRGAADVDDDEDDEDVVTHLPAGSPAWEQWVVGCARRVGLAPSALEWLVLIRPLRILMLLLFLAGCKLASTLGLGPPFILITIIITIFCNLGKRKEGEASAYSVFNQGVRRLPGQLDADQIDQQIRRGQI